MREQLKRAVPVVICKMWCYNVCENQIGIGFRRESAVNRGMEVKFFREAVTVRRRQAAFQSQNTCPKHRTKNRGTRF